MRGTRRERYRKAQYDSTPCSCELSGTQIVQICTAGVLIETPSTSAQIDADIVRRYLSVRHNA